MSSPLPEMSRPQPGSEVPGGVRMPSPRLPDPGRNPGSSAVAWGVVAELARDLLAALLVLGGLATATAATWVYVSTYAGLLVLSACLIGMGLLLGLRDDGTAKPAPATGGRSAPRS